ncbi:MAG: zf-HC2 domain-containing protein [Gemmatimonadota bacterium]|nr:zf-HC2 domain-containing protein [Gemmatimonadota bacterium]
MTNNNNESDLGCLAFDARLPDYLERDLDEASRLQLEAHAAQCTRCSEMLSELGALAVQARALPMLAPSRDLWSGIEARIEAPVLGLPSSVGAGAQRWRRSNVWMSAAAAAGLMIATSGITYALTARAVPKPVAVQPPARAVAPAPTLASAAHTTDTVIVTRFVMGDESKTAGRAQLVNVGARHAERIYGREITALQNVIERRRADLDPRTLAIIDYNITVIEGAIGQTKAALAKDPASHFLLEQLNGALDKKVELLRTAAQLPSRS